MTLTPPKHLYGVLGQPLAQSMSPALHTWGFARQGHPGAYFAWEKDADDLSAFFNAVRSLPVSGLSVTIPHKQAVIPFLNELTPRAKAVGAVNLVYRKDAALIGDNTDVAGFLAPLLHLREQGNTLPARALLLGAGGACRAALAGLRELRMEQIWVSARTMAKAETLARDFACRALDWQEREALLTDGVPTLIINATPLGMAGKFVGASPLPDLLSLPLASGRAIQSVAYDIVYNPVRTVFLAAADELGMTCIDGLHFFVAQAQEQFRLWTGMELPGPEARELLLRLLRSAEDK